MKLRSKAMGQKPMIAGACIDTEIAITSIFSRAKSAFITGGSDGAGTGILAGGSGGMKFSLGGM
jgi:hypothetical protein